MGRFIYTHGCLPSSKPNSTRIRLFPKKFFQSAITRRFPYRPSPVLSLTTLCSRLSTMFVPHPVACFALTLLPRRNSIMTMKPCITRQRALSMTAVHIALELSSAMSTVQYDAIRLRGPGIKFASLLSFLMHVHVNARTVPICTLFLGDRRCAGLLQLSFNTLILQYTT